MIHHIDDITLNIESNSDQIHRQTYIFFSEVPLSYLHAYTNPNLELSNKTNKLVRVQIDIDMQNSL